MPSTRFIERRIGMDEKTITDNRISKDFKYLALYWALGFEPLHKDVFRKNYGDCFIDVYVDKAEARFGGPLTLIGEDALPLTNHKDFVILECVDRLLELGYSATEIIVDLDNEWDVYLGQIYIRCLEWGASMDKNSIPSPRPGTYISVLYSSRLYSGFIDRRQLILNGDGVEYNYGVFDCRKGHVALMDNKRLNENGFIIENGQAVSYIGNESRIVVPEGVTSLASCLFWDNQKVEEILLPDSIERIGGDLCYNCGNLRSFVIPKFCKEMGDDPFAGCPNLELKNESAYFLWDGHLLYDRRGKLIHCQIKNAPKRVTISQGTKTIGKHVFYLCDSIEEITIPSSVIRMQNFPFSGCSKLRLVCQSQAYRIIDGVVYTGDLEELVGCLNGTVCAELSIPEGVKKIDRNSFYRCNGIGKIVFPDTLEAIGYNPFNGCANIEFESKSKYFRVIDGRLYNADVTKLICSPNSKSVGEVRLPDGVIELERSAFSGCTKLTSISLKNVSKIGKSCFSNCSALREVYIPDYVAYVGEWAFSHCASLQRVLIGPDTFIDQNAFSETNCEVIRRKTNENYLIESDNLDFLNGAKNALLGKVSSIIIDPPYNSKIDYIGYQDDFGGSYLDFLEKRIVKGKELLTPTGWMVICIDRGGLKAVKEAAVFAFGKRNVSVRLWKKLDKNFDANKEKKPGKKKVLFEYIVFCRNSDASRLLPVFSSKSGKLRKVPYIFSGYGTTSSAKDEIAAVFGSRSAFSTPKPVCLIKELVRATTPKDGIVMDFFAGSGTLGVATIELNHEDGGDRHYYLVTNSESSFAGRIANPRLLDAEKRLSGSHVFIQ